VAELQKYIEARERNRDIFSRESAAVLQAFEVAIKASRQLGTALTTQRDVAGKTHVGLAPFFLILERSTFAAFEALSANQAFQAWVSIRPGIESALIMGKWVKDPANAEIWTRRSEDPKSYQASFQGKELGKGALSRGSNIQSALRHINDQFLHPNPKYYHRHLGFHDREDGAVEMRLEFFDEPLDIAVGVLGLIHLVIVTQQSLAEMFATLLPNLGQIDVALASFEQNAGSWAKSTMAEGPYFEWALTEIGLWPKIIAT